MLLTPHIVRTHELRQQDVNPIYIGTQQNLGLGGPPPLIAPPGGEARQPLRRSAARAGAPCDAPGRPCRGRCRRRASCRCRPSQRRRPSTGRRRHSPPAPAETPATPPEASAATPPGAERRRRRRTARAAWRRWS